MNPALAWMIAGLVLLIAEMFHGGLFMMWIGAAALLTALAALFIHTEWALWLIFAAASIKQGAQVVIEKIEGTTLLVQEVPAALTASDS